VGATLRLGVELGHNSVKLMPTTAPPYDQALKALLHE
jgi:hypothetical protein